MSSRTVAMSEPVCLIENSENGMHVLPQAMEILKQIDQPVVVVAIVGLYRTGKSYLMNRLAGKQKGFSLGSTIQAQTKGIWMWCVPHPKKANHTLVLLDTEGLGDVEKGDAKNDTWLFCLAVLLSSTLVYNSMGTIDNRALQDLHYVTELTKHIKVKSTPSASTWCPTKDESDEFVDFFPSFVWAVRDFSLRLVHDGKQITADQYLENALEPKPGHGAQIVEDNRLRDCLRSYFPSRKCFVFDCPADPEKMWHMDDLTDGDLKPSFVKQVSRFCDDITNATKTVGGGYEMTGIMLGTLAQKYVEDISSGKIPCVENAVAVLAQIENSKVIAKEVKDYKETMAKVTFPTETLKELSDMHGRAKQNAAQMFKSRCFKDEDQKYQLELMNQLQTEYEAICERNAVESKKACKSIIGRIFKPLEENITSGRYSTAGGYQKYCADLENCIAKYRSTPGKGIKSEESLKEYLALKESTRKAIMTADKSLSDAQRREEENRARMADMERERLAAEEQRKKQLMYQEQAYKKQMKQLEEQKEEEKRAAMERVRLAAEEQRMKQLMYQEQAFKQHMKQLMDQEQAQNKQRERAAREKLEKEVKENRARMEDMERETKNKEEAYKQQMNQQEEQRRVARVKLEDERVTKRVIGTAVGAAGVGVAAVVAAPVTLGLGALTAVAAGATSLGGLIGFGVSAATEKD